MYGGGLERHLPHSWPERFAYYFTRAFHNPGTEPWAWAIAAVAELSVGGMLLGFSWRPVIGRANTGWASGMASRRCGLVRFKPSRPGHRRLLPLHCRLVRFKPSRPGHRRLLPYTVFRANLLSDCLRASSWSAMLGSLSLASGARGTPNQGASCPPMSKRLLMMPNPLLQQTGRTSRCWPRHATYCGRQLSSKLVRLASLGECIP